MSADQSQAAVITEEETQQPTKRSKKKDRSKTKPKRQPPYAVVLHNDDINGMDFVVGALRKVFHYGRLKAIRMMMQAHVTGRAIVWTGSLEVAELKAEQLKSCGADPMMKAHGASSLGVSIEPLPN